MEILLGTLLFILLSPGLLLTLPPVGRGGLLGSQTTSNISVVVHSILFFILLKWTTPDASGSVGWPWNYLVSASNEISSKPQTSRPAVANIIGTVLFILLSPGVILTVPPDEGALIMSQDTNIMAILIHGVAYYVVCKFWSEWSTKGDGNIIELVNDQLTGI